MVTSQKIKSPKSRSLFDHIKHIRSVQSSDYYESLTDVEKKTFSHYMILKALSMDPMLIEMVAELFQYFDKIPSKRFYQLLIGLVPKNNRFCPWIKNSSSNRFNDDILLLVSRYFQVSTLQANEYVNIFFKTDDGINQLIEICRSNGLNESEIEKIVSV